VNKSFDEYEISEKLMTCVVCPKSCRLLVRCRKDSNKIVSVEHASCKRGEEWAFQEITDPVRTLCSSIMLNCGKEPLTGVKTSKPVPLRTFNDLMQIIRGTVVEAPVFIGDIVINQPLGLVCSVVVTRSVDKKKY
jgi:CxxC motif-containing protein